MQWKVYFASAAGRYHLDSGLPCQDAGHYALGDESFVGVVCDGAGSARQAQAGATFMARAVAEAVAQELAAGGLADPAPAAAARLRAIVAGARDALAGMAASQQCTLRDFACTLVGCYSTPGGGGFFHIGDGYAVHRPQSGASVVSLPENGEFADQTYFVTDDAWQEHLRITPLAGVQPGCLIGLMSDGTAPFAIDRARSGFFGPFIDPVMKYLRSASGEDGSRALLGVLADAKTFAITADDKTLLLALAQ